MNRICHTLERISPAARQGRNIQCSRPACLHRRVEYALHRSPLCTASSDQRPGLCSSNRMPAWVVTDLSTSFSTRDGRTGLRPCHRVDLIAAGGAYADGCGLLVMNAL